MATNKTSQKVNIPMLAACVLLCLTLLSLHLTAGLYARYTTSGQANDSARVAAFKVVDTPSVLEETVNFVASPGELVYTINIDNQSETAIAYTFGVENVYGNLPLRFSVNNSTPTAGSASLSMNMAADSSATLTLSVLWEQEGSAAYIGMVDMLRFTVEAAQID